MTRVTPFAEQALSANNEEFTPDALLEAGRNSFSRILGAYGEQSSVQRNEATPTPATTDENGQPILYVSDVGYAELFADAAQMITLYGSENAQGRARPEEVLSNRQVDQVVLHSFGWAIDVAALRAGARSIQVEAQTGHNPYKVYNRLQQVLAGRTPGTTHVISRRGDIYNVLPWSKAPPSNAVRSLAEQQVEGRSISIDLEAWHTTQNIPFQGTDETQFRIVGMMPYTAEQMSALAFLMKKLGLWCTSDVFTSLGFTRDVVRPKLGNGNQHAPGVVNFSAYAPNERFSPGGEFELPEGYKLGDPLPAHLSADAASWNMRFERLYRANGYADGAPLSALSNLRSIAENIRDYSFETELFVSLTAPAVFEAAPPETILAAANEVALAAVGSGYARAQTMQSTTRARMYEAGPIALDAAATAAAELEATQLAQRSTAVTVPATQSALCFNFELQMWGYQQVQIVPDPSTVRLPPPAGTPPGGGGAPGGGGGGGGGGGTPAPRPGGGGNPPPSSPNPPSPNP